MVAPDGRQTYYQLLKPIIYSQKFKNLFLIKTLKQQLITFTELICP